MATIEDAISIAVQAHKGQKDKAGAPYVLHPLRLMLQFKKDSEMMAAVLHDVVEDSDWSIETLREKGIPDEVLTAIDHLTHRDHETYGEFIERVKRNSLATSVKFADLMDNIDISRINNPTESDFARIEKYRAALVSLIESNPKREDCDCQNAAPQSLNFKRFGEDKIFGEISNADCGLCGRHWIMYFWEHEAFTGSARRYLACLTQEQFDRLTTENAKQTIESLDWYYALGGGVYRKRSGKLDLLFM